MQLGIQRHRHLLMVLAGPLLAFVISTTSTAASATTSHQAEETDMYDTLEAPPTIRHQYVTVAGIEIFYRVVGPDDGPTVLLLHGFPSSSHQYRRLMETLGTRVRLVAPDYPGFGFSAAPLPASAGGSFRYSFEQLTDIIEAFCQTLSLERFALYMFDFGGPVGMRLAERRPEWITGLVVQNANAYDSGLSESAAPVVNLRPDDPGAEELLSGFFKPEITRWQYMEGASRPELLSPDSWTLDQYFMDRPGRHRILLDLMLNYHSNVRLYPQWQAWLRQHQPPTLILWGRHDPIFIEAGAHAYLDDLPAAELHLFETGHFALEEALPEMAPLLLDFVERIWAKEEAP